VRTNVTMNALTGDGSKLNKMDKTTERGLPPKLCAVKIIEAIQGRKEEVYIGGAKELYAVKLKRFFPRLFSRAVRKMKVR
jgi:dehydrogenase/reductase SDR family protein 7B